VLGTAIVRRVLAYIGEAAGAYAPGTEQNLRTSCAVFARWCLDHGRASETYPTPPATVAAFIDAIGDRRPVTVHRYVGALNHLHKADGLPEPGRDRAVQLALRRRYRAGGRARHQALGMRFDMRIRLLEAAPHTSAGKRNRAMLAVAYDGLLRASEVGAIKIDDVSFEDDGSARLSIPRSKTDRTGQGAVVYLAPDTVALVRAWMAHASLSEGLLFPSLTTGVPVRPEHLTTAFREMALGAGYPRNVALAVTSHSPRIGAAQDLIAAGLPHVSVMQAGRWRCLQTLQRYAERLPAEQGAVARLARLQADARRTAVQGAASGQVTRAVQHRPLSDPETDEATAWHLAARTVIARRLGLPVRGLALRKFAKDHLISLRQPYFPAALTDSSGTPDSRFMIEAAAVAVCAGPAAYGARRPHHNRQNHTTQDLNLARWLLRPLCEDEEELELTLRVVRHRASRLVTEPLAQSDIASLAKLLLDRRCLSHAALECWLNAAGCRPRKARPMARPHQVPPLKCYALPRGRPA